MALAFYIVAGFTAVAFLAAGSIKLIRPKSALKENGMPWVDDFSSTQVKLIGFAEVLAAAGLILPAATGIAPALSPAAGLALTVLMVGAAVVHVRRKETPAAPIGLAALSLAAAILGIVAIV
jgi:uncharacterized membrane protein